MEAIGLAASVVTLADAAWEISKGLYQLAHRIGTAGEEVRIFTNDFDLFVATFRELGKYLKSLPPVSKAVERATEDLLDIASHQILQPFRELLDSLKPLLAKWKNDERRMAQLGIRIQWAFRHKSKVLFYHGALNALKANVSLLLQTLALQNKPEPHICFILQNSIKDTKISLIGENRSHRLKISSTDSKASSRQRLSNATLNASACEKVDPAEDLHIGKDGSDEIFLEVIECNETSSEEQEDADRRISRISLLSEETETTKAETLEQQADLWASIRMTQRRIFAVADEVAKSSSENSSTVSDLDRTSRSGNETKQTLVVRKPPRMEDNVIYFVDSLGSRFTIPHKAIKTYAGIQEFIHTEYAAVDHNRMKSRKSGRNVGDITRNDVLRAAYYCCYSIYQISTEATIPLSLPMAIEDMIGPCSWERIQPGSRIAMVLDDYSLMDCMMDESVPHQSRLRKGLEAATIVSSR